MDAFSTELRLFTALEKATKDSSSSQLPALHIPAIQLELLTDAQLFDLFKRGSKEAMDLLYSRYRRLVFSTSIKILHDHAEAEDIVQDVFLEICKRAELFDPARGSVKLFILQYAYSRSLDRRKYLALRHSNGRSANGNGNQIHVQVDLDYGPNALDILTFEERKNMICKALDALSPKQKEVFRLICSEGLSTREIADRMDETLGNIRHYYHRGLKKLRVELLRCLGRNGK